MITSMTGFAAGRGEGAGFSWAWDIRAVNGKGLDLRLRVPDWVDGLEAALRGELQKALARGNVSLSLKLTRDEQLSSSGPKLNPVALHSMLGILRQIEAAAKEVDLPLAPTSATDVFAMRGVIETSTSEEDTGPLRRAILADLPVLLTEFAKMRAAEGAALQLVLQAQVDEITRLVAAAKDAADQRRPRVKAALEEAITRLGAQADSFDPARIAQELALLAVKADVTEELDRLGAHIAAARDLLAQNQPVGRKFDFLMQEFLREANTLLSKSQDSHLTGIGLDLKVLIDQMREQVQNVE